MPSENDIEQIRARLNIVDLIGDYVRLQKAGSNYKGLCPFHGEKTPSFTVTPTLGRFYCFGCKESGDIFTFLQKIEGLSFPEAIKRLAERAGVSIDDKPLKSSIAKSEKEAWYHALHVACEYYQKQLRKHEPAQLYLRKRGLDEETIARYKLGFSPDAWDTLAHHLPKQNVKLADAQTMGLVDKGRDGGFFDKFRNRVMFPIMDAQGRVIAFGGRTMGDGEPKYLNSPETPLFIKRNTFYGLSLARLAITKQQTAILVEGYFDVIASQRFGFENTIATLGTAFSEDHAKNLRRFASRVVIAYDSDHAGITAAMRAAEALELEKTEVRVAYLPPGEDPDTLLCEQGSAPFHEAIKNAQPLAAFRLRLTLAKYDLNTLEGRAEMFKEAIQQIASVPSALERDRYIQQLAPYSPTFKSSPSRAEEALRLDVDAAIQGLEAEKKRKAKKTPSQPSQPEATESQTPAAESGAAALSLQPVSPSLLMAERLLMQAACSLEWRDHIWDWIDPQYLEDADHQRAASSIRRTWGDAPPDVSEEEFINRIEDEQAKESLTSILISRSEKLTAAALSNRVDKLSQESLSQAIDFLSKRIQRNQTRQLIAPLKDHIDLLSPDDERLLREYTEKLRLAHQKPKKLV